MAKCIMNNLVDNNYTFSLMIPIWYIIFFILFFVKMYFSRRAIKIMNIVIIASILIIAIALLLFKFNEIYLINWIFKPIVPIVIMAYIPIDNRDISIIEQKDKGKLGISIIIGILIMFIPDSKWYNSLCRNIDYNEYLISQMLIYFCGVITIFLNKYFVNKILKNRKNL